LFIPPVTKADCCLFQTVQEMAENAAAEGWAYTIKGGVVHLDASLEDVAGVCFIGESVIGSLLPDPVLLGVAWTVSGSNFGEVEGEVWLGSAATWEGSVVKVEQNVSLWTEESIGMAEPVQGGLPLDPEHVYVYVINDCGERNTVGFETELDEEEP